MKTQSAAHTPTPWHVGMNPGPIVYGQKGEQIANCRDMLTNDECKENAAFIVRAVNAHDEMLAALKQMRKWALGEDTHDLAYHIRTLEEAIDKATRVRKL